MTIHDKYELTPVINAAGSFTPLGVSRSSPAVGQATAEALSEFFIIDELQEAASRAIKRLWGAEAGAVTHCVAAGITVSVAAAVAGSAPERVAALPDTTGLPNRVVLPAGHAVNYGRPIVQDIRLAGAEPVLAGTDTECKIEDIEAAISHADTACLLLVSSRLVHGKAVDLAAAVTAAHRRGIPAIVDGAAQDMRINELLAIDPDLLLISAHKYLASPTAGLVIGKAELVAAVRAHEKGIGRGMKPTKEAICGVLAAMEERKRLDLPAWRAIQERKVLGFVRRADALTGVSAHSIPDVAGMPFPRAHLRIDNRQAQCCAPTLAQALKAGKPSIWVMEHKLDDGELVLELVQCTEAEIETILARLKEALDSSERDAEKCDAVLR